MLSSSKAMAGHSKDNSSMTRYTMRLNDVTLPSPPIKAGTTVPVLMLLCNDELFCTRFLADGMRAMQIGLAHWGLAAHFYFYDNSKDRTAAIVGKLKTRFPITLESEPLPDHVPKGGTPRSSARCNRIAACRNALVGMALDHILKAPFVLMIDSNIFAGSGALVELVHALYSDDRIGMATACTSSATNRQHYYDTYAFVPHNAPETHRAIGNVCPMRECQERPCQVNTRWKWPALSWSSKMPFDAFSAFGGMAVARPNALLRARWRSEHDQCEHLAFCRDMRAGGHRVVIIPTARALWISDLKKVSGATLNAAHRETRCPVDAATAEKMWKGPHPKGNGGPPRAGRESAASSGPGRAPSARRSVPIAGRRVRVPRVQNTPGRP